MSIPAPGLTLHLSSCDNLTGRDAGHVDQVDRAVGLNKETQREGERINAMNLPSTSTAPAKPMRPQHLPLYLSAPLSGGGSSTGNAGLAARARTA